MTVFDGMRQGLGQLLRRQWPLAALLVLLLALDVESARGLTGVQQWLGVRRVVAVAGCVRSFVGGLYRGGDRLESGDQLV